MNSNIEYALEDVRNGKPVIVIDDYDRENEGDIVIAAEFATKENINFCMLHARGLMCIPCDGKILDRLEIPMMVDTSTDKNNTPFTVSVDAIEGTTTGMSVDDRLKTINLLVSEDSKPSDFARPGHLFPLRPRRNLLLERRGHTEGSIALLQLANLKKVAIIVEIIKEDGSMARLPDLINFADNHDLTIISIEEIYDAVYNKSV